MKKVQSRFLQAVLSPVSGDRITIGLIHWDGAVMRTAMSFRMLPSSIGPDRRAIEDTVRALLREAKNVSTDLQGSLFGIEEVFRVREGFGAKLLWTEVRNARTVDPAANFEELRGLVGLDKLRHVAVTSEKLARKSLVEAGAKLLALVPDRVLVEHLVRKEHEFMSPLSWKNGSWNHTVVANFAQRDEKAIRQRTNNLLGMLQLALPDEDHAVVLAVVPDQSSPLAGIAMEETALLELSERRTTVVSSVAGQAGEAAGRLVARMYHDLQIEQV